jgi:hypothetical protein
MKLTLLLGTPFTVTISGPVVAPFGTSATMLLALQLITVAVALLNRTLLAPCVDPKFTPPIVTGVPASPPITDKPVMLGAVGESVVADAVAD